MLDTTPATYLVGMLTILRDAWAVEPTIPAADRDRLAGLRFNAVDRFAVEISGDDVWAGDLVETVLDTFAIYGTAPGSERVESGLYRIVLSGRRL